MPFVIACAHNTIVYLSRQYFILLFAVIYCYLRLFVIHFAAF